MRSETDRKKNGKDWRYDMINYLAGEAGGRAVAFLGILFAFAATCLTMYKGMDFLPKDHGRDFAVDGKKSAGKPRGAGFLFVLVFIAAALLFARTGRETVIYLILVGAAMLTGFLDDCAKTPWGEYKKGLLDLVIAVMTAVTFLNFNSSEVAFLLTGKTVVLPPALFAVLAVVLVWVSINVTNCSDGVDGLSGTLTIITLMTIFLVDMLASESGDGSFPYLILLFAVCILGYLWYNATPSRLMMGDAGSRAMGLFISIAVLKTGSPFLYIPVALVLILDGGLGLVKVSLLRFLKIRILTKVRTPLHDQARKVWEWSNTQTVFRFAIIQIMLCAAVIYLALP